MTIAKEVVYALHQRLKELAVDATPDKIAYLAKALESIAGQSTVLDIVQITDEKLKELLSTATKHLKDLSDNKTNSLSAITTAKTESLDEINTLKTSSLKALKTSSDSHISLLDTRKDANIAAIDSASDLGSIKNTLKAINDLPEGSSIMKEIQPRAVIQPGSLPLLFGVISRNNDYTWGYGHFTTELGKWYLDTSYTNNMFSLIVGCHNYNTSYVSFYKPPSIYFMQGKNGTFIYRKLYSRYTISENHFKYPYALLGIIFVKNTTSSEITRTLNFVGSAYWNSQYEGAGLFVGTPNNTNTNKGQISSISWQNIYNLGSSSSGFSNSGSIIIPSEKTVAVLFYTSPYYYKSSNNYYTQFMQWGIYNFRSNFLTTGLEIDVERTLRAWQCSGLEHTYQIWQ
ncbi:hypothetical protein [Wolbachia endosymbiont (group B) of Limnophora tigrina]|uniref:hypothetical protein n=1 Tax=Wolbachia endosymbiont (group B) of Limnophora tigrina TaxID=3139317 RepID=UPI0035B50B11